MSFGINNNFNNLSNLNSLGFNSGSLGTSSPFTDFASTPGAFDIGALGGSSPQALSGTSIDTQAIGLLNNLPVADMTEGALSRLFPSDTPMYQQYPATQGLGLNAGGWLDMFGTVFLQALPYLNLSSPLARVLEGVGPLIGGLGGLVGAVRGVWQLQRADLESSEIAMEEYKNA